jgi:hypothetical protein
MGLLSRPVGAAVEDVYTQNRRLWVRLREKGGKRHAMPCHHNLDAYLGGRAVHPATRTCASGRCTVYLDKDGLNHLPESEH